MARFKQGDIIKHLKTNKLILEVYTRNLSEHPRYKYLILENGDVDTAPTHWIDLSGERVG
jgi:hypothetical protein